MSDKIKMLFPESEFGLPFNGDHAKEVANLIRTIQSPPKNLHQRIKQLTEGAQYVLKLYFVYTKIAREQEKLIAAAEEGVEFVNSNKPWDANEDQWIVDRKAEGVSTLRLALDLGRTPASIATRLSQIVGVPKKTIRVEGKFLEGKLGEEAVEGTFTGVIHK